MDQTVDAQAKTDYFFSMDNSRVYHRVKFDCLVEFETAEFSHICELFDISLQGALIGACTGATPGAGIPCKLTINLDVPHKVQIIMLGTTAHKIENRVGIHCESIDIDSMTHLRKVVEYNLGDSELLQRDFSALIENHTTA